LTLWIVMTIVFFAMRLAGDPALAVFSLDTPVSVIEAYRRMWSLDRPLDEQYLAYLAQLARGDFGRSMLDGQPVLAIITERLPKTLELMGFAIALAALLGLPLGVIAALRHNTLADRVIMALAVSGYSIPSFVLGISLILFFSVLLRVLPSGGSAGPASLIMPVLTIGVAIAGTLARFARSSMLDALRGGYVRAASSRGIRWHAVITRHALPNALIPIVTILGLQAGALVGGAVVTETVFSWHGVGQLLVDSVAKRDLGVVQAIVLMIAVSMISANLLVDLTYGWFDPRTRLSSGGLAP
jgi:peptide/nickel transport system permease protein